ncbi:transposase [Streptomyces decoyicus]|uniref:transposase n=1 Tax=Streptomyces decoyicus TaxID=249567 RepID=UPI00362AAB6F
MVKPFADALMSGEADSLCNAECGQVSDERVNYRNGYRPREWNTRSRVLVSTPRPHAPASTHRRTPASQLMARPFESGRSRCPWSLQDRRASGFGSRHVSLAQV